jgi:hypothetical protein
MSETQSPIDASSNDSNKARKSRRTRIAFWMRVALFVIVVVACGWYSGFFQSTWTNIAPLECADGGMDLFLVDFNEMPVRLGVQNNSCTSVGNGECRRIHENLVIRGECRNGQMDGPWSLTEVGTGKTWWTGSYCNGLPCGEFHYRVDDGHSTGFHVQNLHVHGAASIWENQGGRWTEFAGYYDHGKRKGRWVRYVEPAHAIHSASIYDDDGFVTTTSFYCANGNRQEIRGKMTFLFDAQGKTIAENGLDADAGTNSNTGANDPSLCPLP